ncbi:MAG: cell envelope integrity EipB family protein [Hyphomicrobiaceae bacterium]
MLAGAVLSATGAGAAGALTLPEATMLVPHRAIYEVELDGAKSSSGVTNLTGRLVFEFTGSACDGFTQKMRFVMTITNREGSQTTSDFRSSTWENPEGGRFKFSINNFENDRQSEATAGDAVREKDEDGQTVRVDLSSPSSDELTFAGNVLFPVQHTIALLGAARRGEHLLVADLYDGSEQGGKVFMTSTAIGNARAIASDAAAGKAANAERLAGLTAWPVSIAYFDPSSPMKEGIPVHEMSFRFYENGVIDHLAIDYGSLSVKGVLSSLEFFDRGNCQIQ